MNLLGFLSSFGNNPVYIKEVNQEKNISKRKIVRLPDWLGHIFILGLPFVMKSVSGGGFLPSSVYDREVFGWAVFPLILYLFYKGVNRSSHLITDEKEKKTIDSLISTYMTPQEIIKGKFWWAFYPLMMEIVLFAPLFIVAGLIFYVNTINLIMIFILNILVAGGGCMLGIYSSATSSDAKAARAKASNIFIFVVLVYPILSSLAVVILNLALSVLFRTEIFQKMYIFLNIINPLFLAAAVFFTDPGWDEMTLFFCYFCFASGIGIYLYIFYFLWNKTLTEVVRIPLKSGLLMDELHKKFLWGK